MAAGKTIFTINLAKQIKNKKILIVQINSKINDINFLIKQQNSKNEEKNIEIKNINKNINILLNDTENQMEILKEIKKLKENYDLILIDVEDNIECFSILLENIDKIIYLTQANILQIKKSKMQLEEMIEKYKIDVEKVNIVFNKSQAESLSLNIIKEVFKDYNIIGKVNDILNSNQLINHNMNTIYINKKIKKQYQKIGIEILKDKNEKYYFLNKIQNNENGGK